MDQKFIQGLDLCEAFYRQYVGPALGTAFSQIPHSAGIIGSGSEVLGYDTVMSTDHHWGPRAMIFLKEDDLAAYGESITEYFKINLPHTFMGYPTNFGSPAEIGVQLLTQTNEGPINHRVELMTINNYFQDYLNYNPDEALTHLDWLTFSEQKLLTVTAGRIFHDGLMILESIRGNLSYYPHDVWLYLLASQWARIGQEEHFMGRTGALGDELGSRFLTNRLIRDIMKLAFLMDKQYAPYIKWFGTAFKQLSCTADLEPILLKAAGGKTWQERETHLSEAYTGIARMHNDLEITDPIDPVVSSFHGRPFNVIHAGRFVDAITSIIQDQTLKNLPLIGGVDQFGDSTDLLENNKVLEKMKKLFSAYT